MKRSLTIALAGNANVGKSCIFNQLTGLSQTVGNWPGKTVEKAEGTLYFQGYKIKIIDLPGTYSLSAYSAEEVIARDFIASRRADVIIDVVDASALERNLYLTLQLIELEVPMIIALNQVDMAEKKGILIDHRKLSEVLGVKVIPTVAITGRGLNELLRETVKYLEEGAVKPRLITYGREVEERLKILEDKIRELKLDVEYPARWIGIKLLERDPLVIEYMSRRGGLEVVHLAERLSLELEDIHGEPSPVIVATERYAKITSIVSSVQRIVAQPMVRWEIILDYLTTHSILGYVILGSTLIGMLIFVFYVGGLISKAVEEVFGAPILEMLQGSLKLILPSGAVSILVNGVILGIMAGLTIVLPYIIPFHVILSLLEDSGYLPRAAYLTDALMHKAGLHGKALIPITLGFGCNVPACIGCRILETDRERTICGVVTVFVPCAARTIVILGVVATFVGIAHALSIYLIAIGLGLLMARLAYKVMPGEPIDLIMEVPPYRAPSLRSILIKTWSRTKEFVVIAFPIIIAASAFLEALSVLGLIEPLISIAEPLTVGVLGLPAQALIPILFGFLRKELALVMLAESLGTTDFSTIMTASQMYTFALVVAIYIPCVATFSTLVKEFGLKKAVMISLTTVIVALIVGALANAILSSIQLI
ncbi:MAG: ferrous iron transport protein B [Candidatus Nezhaarchaeota archaeon]|nr:ferrous iron transport protein B [Candidatus Nezhaarchaeota archaeon]MCX8141183.1 ferrous iron transport protein B [Candidatus Nezhaarchaeota archaeon]MDW8049449.1 ferrous iron transport protein B [Nitrososphaerota archaeon]